MITLKMSVFYSQSSKKIYVVDFFFDIGKKCRDKLFEVTFVCKVVVPSNIVFKETTVGII